MKPTWMMRLDSGLTATTGRVAGGWTNWIFTPSGSTTSNQRPPSAPVSTLAGTAHALGGQIDAQGLGVGGVEGGVVQPVDPDGAPAAGAAPRRTGSG
jgi:hypothetical protein